MEDTNMSLEEQIQEIIEKALAKGSVSAKDINEIKSDISICSKQIQEIRTIELNQYALQFSTAYNEVIMNILKVKEMVKTGTLSAEEAKRIIKIMVMNFISSVAWDSNEERQRYVKELEGIANLDAMTELSK